MQTRNLLTVLAIVILSTTLGSCGSHHESKTTDQSRYCLPDSFVKKLSFDTVALRKVSDELPLSGRIMCNEDRVTNIFPLVSGHIISVRASLGDHVKEGSVLAVIESADMASYYGEFESAGAELEISKKNLEVTGNMRNSGITSEKDYLVARNEYQKTLSEYNKIKEILKINGKSAVPGDSTGSGYSVISPINGFIVAKNINPGMDIRSDAGDFLFTVSDLKEVWAIANVYESDIAKIRHGQDADITTLSYPGAIFKGKVQKISDILDPDTRLISIRIGLDNPEYKLKPGMFAHVLLHFPEERKMFAVKTSSLIFDLNKTFVILYRNKCDIVILETTVYSSVEGISYIVCDSLHEGDVIIAKNGLFVYTVIRNQ